MQDQIKRTGSIVMPPPNVTGVLHLGHALNLFIQDTLVRFYSQHGMDITWIPGTDHAGIATQLLVQNRLRDEGISLNPEELEEKIWEWARFSEKNICGQLKEMDLALDWQRYTFSLDERVQEAVREAFCKLYNKGLIFLAKRMVNWDIKLQTVLSDIETQSKEIIGQMHYIRYLCEDKREILVATTRPETIFADQAIAVNPDDVRYHDFIGRKFIVPLTNRLITMVADKNCDPTTGTGAVKIDPAHGFLDFEIAQKYNLPIQEIIDKQGKMCGQVPDSLRGLDRFETRKIVIDMLQNCGALVKSEDIKHMVPHGIRSDSILEPLLSDQWFFDIPKLKEKALKALDDINLHPARFNSIYKHYINNLQPWCISRQIIWGHKIPAWYDESGQVYIARTLEEAQKTAGNKTLTRDSDVLDTWFSSGLWPLVNAGWPGKLDQGYPNLFLVTGSDILFFWVLKMILIPLALEQGIPFKNVLLHGLVQDSFGLKMSKSKGNVVEPISFIREYGADVMRFALLSAAVAGNNVRFGQPSIEMARKFLTKLHNAMGYCTKVLQEESEVQRNATNNVTVDSAKKSDEIIHPVNRWILDLVDKLEEKIENGMQNWDLYHTAIEIYSTFWDGFCSWYIECSKALLKVVEFRQETLATLREVCLRLLRAIYPFSPETTLKYWADFSVRPITEEIAITITRDKSNDFDNIQRVVELIRSIKFNPGLTEDLEIKKVFISPNFEKHYIEIVSSLANTKLEITSVDCEVKFGCAGFTVGIPDLKREKAIPVIKKMINNLEKELNHVKSRLNDCGFLENADPTDIDQKRNRLVVLSEEIEVYKTVL